MNTNKALRLTTVDNPYDPFTHWKEWLLFDINSGYHTCARLARVTYISDAFIEEEIYERVEEGMNVLITTGCIAKDGSLVEYKKVVKTKQ